MPNPASSGGHLCVLMYALMLHLSLCLSLYESVVLQEYSGLKVKHVFINCGFLVCFFNGVVAFENKCFK